MKTKRINQIGKLMYRKDFDTALLQDFKAIFYDGQHIVIVNYDDFVQTVDDYACVLAKNINVYVDKSMTIDHKKIKYDAVTAKETNGIVLHPFDIQKIVKVIRNSQADVSRPRFMNVNILEDRFVVTNGKQMFQEELYIKNKPDTNIAIPFKMIEIASLSEDKLSTKFYFAKSRNHDVIIGQSNDILTVRKINNNEMENFNYPKTGGFFNQVRNRNDNTITFSKKEMLDWIKLCKKSIYMEKDEARITFRHDGVYLNQQYKNSVKGLYWALHLSTYKAQINSEFNENFNINYLYKMIQLIDTPIVKMFPKKEYSFFCSTDLKQQYLLMPMIRSKNND